jgi:hypothetical protein
MLRFIKSFWIATLAAAATFTSCVRLDAGSGSAVPAKSGPAAPVVAPAVPGR